MKKYFVGILLICQVFNLLSQEELPLVNYTNPENNSQFNYPATEITIGFESISESQFKLMNISLLSEDNQIIKGTLSYSEKYHKLFFKPDTDLLPGKYYSDVLYEDKSLKSFAFWVRPKKNETNIFRESFVTQSRENTDLKSQKYLSDFGLPDDFPAIEIINKNNPNPGYYILNRLSQTEDIPLFLMIMDTNGFPIFYRRFQLANPIQDFVLQEETGTLTYYSLVANGYVEIDSSYNYLNTYVAQNGYNADGHEMRLMADGSYWLMIYDSQIVDMSVIVPGGQVEATVEGLIIQHISSDGNVLFQWSSWEHFQITDADPAIVNLTATGIDYVHGNALDFDENGNLLLSSRNLSEITKINTTTGDIIWRFGGTQNQFQIIGDSINFSAQHHIRYNGNGLYSLFDNGWGRSVKFSRGLEYQLNEEIKTAYLIRDDNHYDSMVFSPVMGSYTKGPSGEWVTGWSINQQRYVLTELDSLSNKLLEIRSLDTNGLVSYRAGKINWETNAIDFDADEYYVSQIQLGDSAETEIVFTNNLNTPFILNGFYSSDSCFSLIEELPVILNPGEQSTFHINFKPLEERTYSSSVSFYTDNTNERIAKQFRINTALVLDNSEIANYIDVRLFPNPANEKISISSPQKIDLLEIYNLQGKLIKRFTNVNNEINISDIPKGIYLINVHIGSDILVRKLIKH